MTELIVSTETFREFLRAASIVSSERGSRARSERRKNEAAALASIFSFAADSAVTYDGNYCVTVPLDAVVRLAEVASGETAPQAQRSA